MGAWMDRQIYKMSAWMNGCIGKGDILDWLINGWIGRGIYSICMNERIDG